MPERSVRMYHAEIATSLRGSCRAWTPSCSKTDHGTPAVSTRRNDEIKREDVRSGMLGVVVAGSGPGNTGPARGFYSQREPQFRSYFRNHAGSQWGDPGQAEYGADHSPFA